MSGCVRLCRLVIRTFDDATPSGTGWPASSVHSAMQVSLANVMTGLPGSLWPTRPSVETNISITGTPNAAPMAARSAGLIDSDIEVTERRFSRRRPSRCSRASSASLAAYAIRDGGWAALSRRTISAVGRLAGADTRRTGGPAAVAAPRPLEWTGEPADGLDEQAAPPGAAARQQADVGAEQQRRVRDGPGQVPLHQVPGQPPVGGDGVEARHHLRLGHDRQPGQVGQLEPAGVDAAQAPRMEGRAVDGPRQQRPQPVALTGGELPGAPGQVPDLARQPGGHGVGHASAQQLKLGDRGGHLSSPVGTDPVRTGGAANQALSLISTGSPGPPRAPGLTSCSSARPVSMASMSSASCRGGNGRPSAPPSLTEANISATPSTVRACKAAYRRLSSGSRPAWIRNSVTSSRQPGAPRSARCARSSTAAKFPEPASCLARPAFCAARSAIRSSSRTRNMSALLVKREYTAPLENPASSAICSRVAA